MMLMEKREQIGDESLTGAMGLHLLPQVGDTRSSLEAQLLRGMFPCHRAFS